MGAEGGICYIGVKDAKAYEKVMRLAGWLINNMYHRYAYGYKYPHAEFCTEPTFSGYWKGYPESVTIEGAYGTDICGSSLERLYGFVSCNTAEELFDGPVSQLGTPISGYTFAELQESYLTRPKGPDYTTGLCAHEWWNDSDIKFIVENLDDVPDSIKDMTLGEWSRRINELIIGYYDEETWT